MEAILDAARSKVTDSAVADNGRAQVPHGLDSLVCAIPRPSYGDDLCTNDCWSEGINEISAMAARLLSADACMIMLSAGNISDRLTFRAYCGALPVDDGAKREQTRQAERAAQRAICAGRPLVIDERSC